MATLYGHQSRIAATEGQILNQGDVLGFVGTTGHSTGNHLHFEIRVDTKPRNPRPVPAVAADGVRLERVAVLPDSGSWLSPSSARTSSGAR